MYQTSADFHTAVANGNPQMALLVFPDAIFSNEDIDVDRGIEFNDYFNMEEDIAIGQALSNELTFSLFNDKRLLNNYGFGEMKATLGVKISESSISYSGNCMVQEGNDTYIGRNSNPYLRKNGSTMANAPTWAVHCLLIKDGKLYCFGDSNTKVFKLSDGSVVSETPNAFMQDKVKRDWWNMGVRYNETERSLKMWKGAKVHTYEFVPLGTFIADRPNAPDNIEIDFHCNDLMMKFKDDMPGDSALGISYPVTFKALLQALCTKCSVPYGAGDFINSTATLAKRPEEFDNCTMREVVAWIAEAAGSNARINRDGYLVMDWIHTLEQGDAMAELDEHDYMDYQPYWYTTEPISKLHNRTTQDNSEKTAGTGSVGYLIQDNPLLKGVS